MPFFGGYGYMASVSLENVDSAFELVCFVLIVAERHDYGADAALRIFITDVQIKSRDFSAGWGAAHRRRIVKGMGAAAGTGMDDEILVDRGADNLCFGNNHRRIAAGIPGKDNLFVRNIHGNGIHENMDALQCGSGTFVTV